MLGRSLVATLMLVATVALLPGIVVAEHGEAESAFDSTWQRTDLPVLSDLAQRTWIWGPEPVTDIIHEPYAETETGERSVQYYDKSRMEVTDLDENPASIWYVTNGLLVIELMTGRMQVGDNAFEERNPADVNVAGDATDAFGPTYRTMAGVRNEPASAVGETLNQRLSRSGSITVDVSLENQGVQVATVAAETGHSIAEPFWEFMNSSGTVFVDGGFSEDLLFENPYFATGYPVTEPYWADVIVDGVTRLVLLQCFQRRCLTYTPDNAPEWQVEAGNVGLHYRSWRYDSSDGGSDPNPTDCMPGDGQNYAGQNLVQPSFISSNVVCADFSDTVINQGNFTGANAALADFSNAELRQPIFRNTNLDGAVFVEALVVQPVFNGSTAIRANFANATLSQPIFSGANLLGADMASASMTMPQFSNTICPDSSNSDDNGGTCLGHLEPITPPVP